MSYAGYGFLPPLPERTPNPKIAHAADKDEVLEDQLAYLVSVHAEHNLSTLCYCVDCSQYHRVAAELLSKFDEINHTPLPEPVRAKKAKA